MNLFTQNSPYYHLLKCLLFLLKHPVCVCVCVYIYIYIYIHETGLVIDRFMLRRVYHSHHPVGRQDRIESEQILCSNVTRAWTGSTISRWCTFFVPWNNYSLQVIRTARTHTYTHANTCTLKWRLVDQNCHAWEFRWVERTSGSRFWYECIICGVTTSSHTRRQWGLCCQTRAKLISEHVTSAAEWRESFSWRLPLSVYKWSDLGARCLIIYLTFHWRNAWLDG
jgi:hypothetical protein